MYGEDKDRPRQLAEISNSSNLILLVESRLPMPDLGNWAVHFQVGPAGHYAFQSHNGFLNFLFADTHAKRVKFAAACTEKMWSDTFPVGDYSCQQLDQLPEEYR